MILTEKKLLSDCGNKLVIDDGNGKPEDIYIIEIDNSSNYIILKVGGCVNKPISKFSHPNIITSRKEVYEFKHYRKGGSKFWTSQAGISHYFIISKDKVSILPEKGYSWIHAEINGVKVHFNVSGGGGSGGWSDYLREFACISINHKLRDIKKIAEVSVINGEVEELKKKLLAKFTENDNLPNNDREEELKRWEKLANKVSPSFNKDKAKLLQRIEAKSLDVKICLKDGYLEKTGIGIEVHRNGKRTKLSDTSWEWDMNKGRLKNIIVHFTGIAPYTGFPRKVKDSQINWEKTIKENEALLQKVVDNPVTA